MKFLTEQFMYNSVASFLSPSTFIVILFLVNLSTTSSLTERHKFHYIIEGI